MRVAERARLRLRQTVGALAERWPGSRPFFCPVCGQGLRAFHPLPRYHERVPREHGFPYRLEDAETLNWRHYTCRRCGASDRDRLIALYVREMLDGGHWADGCRMVDFAPSPPLRDAFRAMPGVEYRSADLWMAGVDDQVDVAALPYADGQFDLFVCSHVLEHVPDDRAALRELYRVLASRGRGILMVPIVLAATEIDEDAGPLSAAERWRRFGQDDHVRLYSKQGFVERVRAAGFRLTELGATQFGAETFLRCGLAPTSVLYVVARGDAAT